MTDRLPREDFFRRLAPLDEDALRKALWTLYWRGSAQMRERILDTLDPVRAKARRAAANAPADGALTLERIKTFAGLARAGAYLGHDRRVSPSQRTKWRTEFKELATDALSALRGEDTEKAVRAVEILVDLACEMGSYDYFRSEDSVAAARFVVSDAAEAIWTLVRVQHGTTVLAERATPQLIRWERRYGWTRYGEGWVAERERSLTEVLAPMLANTDAWGAFADAEVHALDALATTTRRHRYDDPAHDRAANLAQWHAMLLERLVDTEYEPLLDTLVKHPALVGSERTFLASRLAHLRGDDESARRLIARCLKDVPGHSEYREFALVLGSSPEPPS
ncbi:MAG: hypothetical protein L0L02_10770 [Corynebacterium variabile]|nr:hypothetical protein [Corynebacterium variabile]